MRYEQILAKDSFTKVEVAAVWPNSIQVAPLPLLDIDAPPAPAFLPVAAAPDVPAAVGRLIVGAYVALLGAFALATIASAYSIYMIAICALYLVAFFAVPWLFFRQEPHSVQRPSLRQFMRNGIDTLTGHSSGADALVQMLVVPVLLTLGVLVIAIAAAIIL